MVNTRRGTDASIESTEPTTTGDKKVVDTASAKAQPTTNENGRKRRQAPTEQEERTKQKKAKSHGKVNSSVERNNEKGSNNKVETNKPRLTAPELEFDYDRSQLRDPRETPGRKRRPRYDEFDIPADVKADLLKRFDIPKPEKPKGRLNSVQKDELFIQECLLDPIQHFHALNICYKKGSQGSPTYDSAGFQLDFEKVADWKKPQAYNKGRIVNGMERHLEKRAREEKEICRIFFKDDVPDSDSTIAMMEYLKDHVSKDLGVPWHQIGPEELRRWEKEGFEKQDYQKWWHEPNQEEKKRMLKMLGGASLRKNL